MPQSRPVMPWLLLAVAGCAQPPMPPPTAPAAVAAPAADPARPPLAEAAQPDLPEQPGLPDYLARAALANPALAAAFHQWKAALEVIPQARALPDPRFTYGYYIRNVETRVGPQRNSFQLMQMFPWLGKLEAREGAAAEAARAARLRYEARKLALFHQVKDAYYEYYYLGRAVAVTQDNVRLLEQLEQVVQVKYRANLAAHADLIRLQVELGRLRDRLRSLRDMRAPAMAALNAAMDLPPGRELPWPDQVEPAAMSVGDEQLVAWAGESSPDLQALAADVAERRRQVDLARSEYVPDVSLGLTWIDTGPARMGMHPPDSGADPLVAMVTVNVPVWFERLAAGVREARSRELAAAKQQADATNQLAAQVKMAAYQHRDAQGRIDLYDRVLIPRATESLQVTRKAFEGGRAGFTDLIDAQRVLLEFQLAHERARAERARQLARLEMLVGRPLPRADEPSSMPATQPAGD